MWDCLDLGGEWKKQDANFDNVGIGMVTMFNLMTMENWTITMFHGMDATEIFQQPSRNTSPEMAMFFIVFLVIGTLIILNLFVAVIIDTFFQEKEKLTKNAELTLIQQEYVDSLIKCYSA